MSAWARYTRDFMKGVQAKAKPPMRLHIHRPLYDDNSRFEQVSMLYCRKCGQPIVPVLDWLRIYRKLR